MSADNIILVTKAVKMMPAKLMTIISIKFILIESDHPRPVKLSIQEIISIPKAFLAHANNAKWWADTRSTKHVIYYLDNFIKDPRPNKNGNRKIRVNGGIIPIKERDTAVFLVTNIELKDYLYAPKFGARLISIQQLCTDRFKGTFNKYSIKIVQISNPDNIILRAKKRADQTL